MNEGKPPRPPPVPPRGSVKPPVPTPSVKPPPESNPVLTPGVPRTYESERNVSRAPAFHLVRSRHYAFSLDQLGQPIEIGSGRFAKVFLGEERWVESLTNRRRPIVIKMLQKGVASADAQRFQIEKELLERVQGHPGIVELLASGVCEDVEQLPVIVRNTCEASFMILERMDMSLEERLKGSRSPQAREDLLALSMRDRLLRVLEYVLPVAAAIEYAHVLRNVCHRDIKPGNILIGLPHPKLAGSGVQVRLADFNIAKLSEEAAGNQMTRLTRGVPGTLYFQSPEQEMNLLEILVNVEQGATDGRRARRCDPCALRERLLNRASRRRCARRRSPS